jgi:hypothetical protein
MANCLYKIDTECVNTPRKSICANCRIRLIATDPQFATIDWQQNNGFIMIEKCCHTCEFGVYGSEELKRSNILVCIKMMEAGHDAEIVDSKQYVCDRWNQRDVN